MGHARAYLVIENDSEDWSASIGSFGRVMVKKFDEAAERGARERSRSEEGTMYSAESRTLRRVVIDLLVVCQVVGVLVLSATSAEAQATILPLYEVHTDVFTAPLEGCLPEDQIGTVTLTETSTGQRVITGERVVTVHGVNVYDYRLDLPDGRYVQSWTNRDRYSTVDSSTHFVTTMVTQDFRTIYSAGGTPQGRLAIHAGLHITYNYLTGEVTSDFEYFSLRCM